MERDRLILLKFIISLAFSYVLNYLQKYPVEVFLFNSFIEIKVLYREKKIIQFDGYNSFCMTYRCGDTIYFLIGELGRFS